MKKSLINAIAIIVTILIIVCKAISIIIENNNYQLESQKDKVFFEKIDEEIQNEKEYYSFSMSKTYKENFNNPYILDGFRHVEGEWNTGFVVEDELGNQFVWVPVFNEIKEDVVKLSRKNFIINPIIPIENCFNDNYEKFIKSALENGGFYISRYETRN